MPEWYKTGPPEISEGLLVLRIWVRFEELA